jgi:hypothetical protein
MHFDRAVAAGWDRRSAVGSGDEAHAVAATRIMATARTVTVKTDAAPKRDDLVVVAGDPLADIRAIRKVSKVVARGVIYDPAALWRLVGFAPDAAKEQP